MQLDVTQAAVSLLQKMIVKIKPGTSTSMKSAVVALFSADPQGKLRYSGMIGLLQIDMDRHYKSKFLRIYDLQSLSLVFEVQIYYGFQQSYRMVKDGLYVFDYPRGSIGFQFKTKEEGEIMKIKIFTNCPSMQEYQEIKKRNLQMAKKKQQQGTFLGKLKNFFGDKKEEEQHQSEIISFKKNTSISFNLADGTFNTENVPPQWQQVFDKLKLTKDDLNNKEVMGIIIEQTVLNQAKRQAEQQSNKDLQKKVNLAQQQINKQQIQFKEDIKRNTILNLPLPPPPPPPPLLAPPSARVSLISARGNLMDEIRSNNLRLKHVQIKSSQGQQSVNLDISDMNREERNDHIENMRLKLIRRKAALNRRQADQGDY